MKAPFIQVYILTYNRPEYLTQAIQSVLNQSYDNFSVIVSDNSTNDETEKQLQSFHHPKLTYIRRIPSTPSLDHYRTVLSEASSDYFMIFHDDDIMEPDCLRILSAELNESPSAAAAAGNANVFWDSKSIPKRKMFKQGKDKRTFQNPDELAGLYLTFEGIAPFPSYMYRKNLIDGLLLNPEEGGQNADVSFLLKVLNRGEIIWVNRCIMSYRKHSSQDSQGPNIKDMQSLLSIIHENTGISKKTYEARYFRHKAWAGVLKSYFFKTGGKLSEKRMKTVYWSIFRFSPFDIFLKLFIWRIRAVFSSKRT